MKYEIDSDDEVLRRRRITMEEENEGDESSGNAIYEAEEPDFARGTVSPRPSAKLLPRRSHPATTANGVAACRMAITHAAQPTGASRTC